MYALLVLECYRVVLLQRSPMLYPFSILEQSQTLDSQPSLLPLLRHLTSSDGSRVDINSLRLSIQSLCAITILGAHTQCLPGHPPSNAHGTDGHFQFSSGGWRKEFIELALHKWLCSHVVPPAPDVMMLYHMVHLSMYCNFSDIERLARWTTEHSVNDEVYTTSEFDINSERGKIPGSLRDSSHEHRFTTEGDEEKAVWHANRIVKLAQQLSLSTIGHGGDRVHLLEQSQAATRAEMPHYSYAVYYASIVLCCATTFTDFPRSKNYITTQHSKTARVQLRQGIDLLSISASRVANVFKNILKALHSRS